MGVVALLVAFAVGAGAATVMSVFGFMAALTSLLVGGSVTAIAVSDSPGRALWLALALFVAAQVGYVSGIAALARLRHREDGRRSPDMPPRRHFRVRK